MSNFEDFSVTKVTCEKGQSPDADRLKINLADASRDDFQAMDRVLQNRTIPNALPNCEIDLNPGAGTAARLIHAFERRGFEVDVDKEKGTIEISKEIKLDAPLKHPELEERVRGIVLDTKFGRAIEPGRHLDLDLPHRFGWRERAVWQAVKHHHEC